MLTTIPKMLVYGYIWNFLYKNQVYVFIYGTHCDKSFNKFLVKKYIFLTEKLVYSINKIIKKIGLDISTSHLYLLDDEPEY